MEDFVRDQKNVGRKTITTLLDVSVADMKEEEELDRFDFETLIDEIRVS